VPLHLSQPSNRKGLLLNNSHLEQNLKHNNNNNSLGLNQALLALNNHKLKILTISKVLPNYSSRIKVPQDNNNSLIKVHLNNSNFLLEKDNQLAK
jgi:hypothetical protein